jgi:hypothetical protein
MGHGRPFFLKGIDIMKLPTKMGSFSIGEAGFLMQVSREVIAAHCDKDLIRWYRPGPRGHRRIAREALLVFMARYEIPLDISLQGDCPQRSGTPPPDFYRFKRAQSVTG